MRYLVRNATLEDISVTTEIYNQGIEDRIATLETVLRNNNDMEKCLLRRGEKYKVIVIEDENNNIHSWASLNVFNSRCCYSGVVDVSIYI